MNDMALENEKEILPLRNILSEMYEGFFLSKKIEFINFPLGKNIRKDSINLKIYLIK